MLIPCVQAFRLNVKQCDHYTYPKVCNCEYGMGVSELKNVALQIAWIALEMA